MSAQPDLTARVLAVLRPDPQRGDLIAAGAVPLTVAVVMLNTRFDGEWSANVLFVLTALFATVVYTMGVLAALEEEFPRAHQTVLLLCGLVLALLTLLRLAEVLGADDPLASSGTLFWVFAVLAVLAALPAARFNSPVCALVAAAAGGIALLAFVEWAFDPEGASTFRYMLVVLMAIFIAIHVQLRDRHPRHAVHLVNAAGLAALALVVSFLGEFVGFLIAGAVGGDGPHGAAGGPGTGWEVVIVTAGMALLAYAALDRQPGPGYLGFLVLLVFALLSGQAGEDGASLIGWPLLLLAAGVAAIAFGVRPRGDGRAAPGSAGPVAPTSTPPPSTPPPAPPGAGEAAEPPPAETQPTERQSTGEEPTEAQLGGEEPTRPLPSAGEGERPPGP